MQYQFLKRSLLFWRGGVRQELGDVGRPLSVMGRPEGFMNWVHRRRNFRIQKIRGAIAVWTEPEPCIEHLIHRPLLGYDNISTQAKTFDRFRGSDLPPL